MGDSREDSAGVRWLTYEEAGQALGIDADSVVRRARRRRWRRQPGNDGRTRVAVPLDILADILPGVRPDSSKPSDRDVPEDDGADIPPDVSRTISALEGEAATLREALARERERADRIEAEAGEAWRALSDARERAARAEGEVQARREAEDRERQARQQAEAQAAEAGQAAALAQQRAEAAEAVTRELRGMSWWRRAMWRPG